MARKSNSGDHSTKTSSGGVLHKDALALPFYYKKANDIDPVEVGRRLSAIRKKLNLTMSDMAVEFGVSVGSIGRIEMGDTCPTGRILVLLHERYGVDINWLLFGCHCLEQDLYNAIATSNREIKFDLFTRLYSYFLQDEIDDTPFIYGEKTCRGVNGFAKWNNNMYRKINEQDVPDDETEFESDDKLVLSSKEIAIILKNVSDSDKERIMKLIERKKP